MDPPLPLFTEGVKREVTITGKILGGAKAERYKLQVVKRPKGSKVEKLRQGKALKFVWTPRYDSVEGREELSKRYDLEVKLTALGEGEGDEVSYTKVFPLRVEVNYPPLAPELLAIEVDPPVVNLEEGVRGEFVVSGKFMGSKKGTPYSLEIKLPGARQEKLKGGAVKVVWTPPLTTVSGDNYFIQHSLPVKLKVEDQDEDIVREATIPLWVRTQTRAAPEIKEVSVSKQTIPENEGATMTITVKDESSTPTLHFVPVVSGRKGQRHLLRGSQQTQGQSCGGFPRVVEVHHHH